tara:strand:+ start:579 stop:749 length:171 start_codon:yes stop_codon:yes gene_type:complete
MKNTETLIDKVMEAVTHFEQKQDKLNEIDSKYIKYIIEHMDILDDKVKRLNAKLYK